MKQYLKKLLSLIRNTKKNPVTSYSKIEDGIEATIEHFEYYIYSCHHGYDVGIRNYISCKHRLFSSEFERLKEASEEKN